MDQNAGNKLYIVIVGAAPMASLDALIISLDRFRNSLTSESAQTQFETAVRSIKHDIKDVHAFVDSVYAKRDPKFSINLPGRTLVVEVAKSENDFYACIHDQDVDDILSNVTAVGSMPAKKLPTQKTRDYTVFPIRYFKGQFMKA
jgi:hypothetical protein